MGKIGRFNLLDMKINGCKDRTRVCVPEKSNSPVSACLLRDNIRLSTGGCRFNHLGRRFACREGWGAGRAGREEVAEFEPETDICRMSYTAAAA